VGVPSRAEVKTTRERGADRENTEGQRGGGKDNTDSRPAASNGKERATERTETKKKRGEHTDIRHTMLSSTRRRATLNTGGGPTTNVRVGKEAVKVSEMGGRGAGTGTGTEYEVRTMPTRLRLVLITSSKGQRRREEDEENREKNGYEGGKRWNLLELSCACGWT
jgi:hypothetical protein